MTLTLESLIGEARIIADSLAVQWPGIDADDIQQEMLTALAARWDSLPKKDRRKIALGVAKREGLNYCIAERTYYQHNTAEWVYTPKEVRAIVAELFTEPLHVDTPARPSKGKEYLTADGVSILIMDARNAFESVSEAHQAAIVSAFHDGERPSSGSEKMRLSRAIDAMTAALNRQIHSRTYTEHDGPGARTALSNTQARYATGTDY